MQITKSYEQFDIRVDRALSTRHSAFPRPNHPHTRTTNVWHVSTLIKHLAITMGLLNETDLDKDITYVNQAMSEQQTHGKSELLTRIALGLAWEDWIAKELELANPERFLYHPGEMVLDDIYMSPDAIELQEHDPTAPPTLHEFKLTWGEAGLPIERKWYWLAQVRAYCKALGTTHAVLHVTHANGHLRANHNKRTRAGLPLAVRYDIQLTQEELDSTWKTILTTRSTLVANGTLPE